MIPPIVAPFMPTPASPSRFVKRGFFMCCTTCGLTIDYCRGHALSSAERGAQDGAESSLEKRARECKGKP